MINPAKFTKYLKDTIEGKFAGLAIIFEQYYRYMLYEAYVIVYCKYNAEDVVSEVFLRFMERKVEIKVYIKEPRLYLAKIVQNAARDYLRKEKKHLCIDDFENSLQDENADRQMNRIEFFDFLKDLDEVSREIVIAHVFESLRFSTIAAKMNLPKSTVTTKYYRALQRFREEFPDAAY